VDVAPEPVADTAGPDARPAAATLARPLVEAVVVAGDPGPWFRDALCAWADQEYDGLGVTVVDNGSAEPLDGVVTEALPGARLVRLDRAVGYGQAVAAAVERLPPPADPDHPGYLLLAHDDAAPEPGTVSILVQEALAGEAALVGPKIVHWDTPEELEDLGIDVDLFGAKVPLIERGELDQAQHDARSDVFGVSAALALVHRTCFEEVGGIDPAIDFHGEDVDLSWRIRAAGGRVRVAPDAVVRHVGGGRDRSAGEDERRRARHQLRATLANHGIASLVLIVPQLVVLSLAEAVYGLAQGRIDRVRTVVGAWVWNLWRLPGLVRRRRVLHAVRRIPEAELRSQLLAPHPRWRVFVAHDHRVDQPTHDPLASMRSAPVRFGVTAWLVALLLLGLGARDLLLDGVPAVGRFQPLPMAPGDLVSEWWQGWRDAGLGHAGPAPFALALAGVVGRVAAVIRLEEAFLPALVVVSLLVGLRGAWRLGRWAGPGRPQAALLLVYALLPVAPNAIAAGRLDGLVVWAVAPWLLLRLARAQGIAPFPRGRAARARPLAFDAVLLGFVLALATAFSPVASLAFAVIVVGYLAGSLVAGSVAGLHRMVAAAVVGAAIAAFAHLGYLLDLLDAGEWAPVVGGGDPRGGPASLAELIRMASGPFGASWVSWAVLAVGAGGLVVGRGWRFAWCVRGWFVALAGWGLAWVGERGWLELTPPAPEVGLSVAAVGIALATAASAAAYEHDLRAAKGGGGTRLDRLAPLVTALALVGLLVPALGVAVDGRFGLPPKDLRSALEFLDDDTAGAARVLWIGDQEILPVLGWPLGDGVAYGTTEDGLASFADQWVPPEGQDTRLLADAVRRAAAGGTTRLGAELAPMAVRHVVVVHRSGVFGAPEHPVPAPYRQGLGSQLDLQLVPATTSAATVYRNLAWVPGVADLATGAVEDPEALDLSRATPVLERRDGYTARRGGLVAGTTVYHAVSRADGWQLAVEGEVASPEPALGWAQRFTVPAGGEGVLSYRPDGSQRLLAALQLAVFAVLFLGLGSWRTRLERSR
jgi:GT2 family glycosyltransferase